MSRAPTSAATKPSRLLFASCNSQHRPQTLWPAIRSRNATAFVWAGDAVYADDFDTVYTFGWPRIARLQSRDATPSELAGLLHDQLTHDGYQSLVKDPTVTILGALDDHDYGANNGDLTYAHKAANGAAYVDFLTAQKPYRLDAMRQRAVRGQGVYGVQVFDFSRPVGHELVDEAEAGIEPDHHEHEYNDNHNGNKESSPSVLSNQSVAVFLLDVRSNKTPWKQQGLGKYRVDYAADFLGPDQWVWFETALRRSTATVNVIVQGLQVHADRYIDGNVVEDWSRFPAAQHRLYQTILQSNVQAPILVSGDVHMAELLRKDCQPVGRRQTDGEADGDHRDANRMLLEVTTSGMTHSWGSHICARPESSWSCRNAYVDWSMSMGMHVAHHNGAWTDLVDLESAEEGAKAGIQYNLDLNFGEFEFDWEAKEVKIRIHGNNVNATAPYLSTRWDFDTLSGKTPAPPTGLVRDRDFDDLRRDLQHHGVEITDRDYVCVAYRGPQTLALKTYGCLTSTGFSSILLLIPILIPLILLYWVISGNSPYAKANKRQLKID
jgi:hypothetical protein